MTAGGTGIPVTGDDVNRYIARTDIETVFGKGNIAKWADLDNEGNTTDISDRIDAAITWASNEVDSMLRNGPYDLPLACSDGAVPREVVDIVSNLAGVWLYENRGIQDFNAETGQAVHKLQWNRKRAYDTLREIASLKRRINVTIAQTAVPGAPYDLG